VKTTALVSTHFDYFQSEKLTYCCDYIFILLKKLLGDH
jgi:hypothetical protein